MNCVEIRQRPFLVASLNYNFILLTTGHYTGNHPTNLVCLLFSNKQVSLADITLDRRVL